MKKYVKPIMEGQMFVSNEYVSACGDVNGLSCLNMNKDQGIKGIFYDVDGNGIYDSTIDTSIISFSERQDCGTNGSATGGNHDPKKISRDTLVFVVYNNGTVVPSYKVTDVQQDSPHFISVKTANHS